MRQFILGTDWWTDCDDAVAVRLLARAHKAEDIRLLGIAINACMDISAASLDGFLQLEGVEDMPLGIDAEATDFGGSPAYQARLAPFARRYTSNEQAEPLVRLYRRLLAAATEPVELIEIGYMQGIAALLDSPADDLSPLNGRDLVLEKVSKVWMMAGKWSLPDGRENNFCRNRRTAVGGARFCAVCPVPVTFLGFEVGEPVLVGGELDRDDPLYGALVDHGSPNGRSAWDPMLVRLALIGDETAAGYTTVRGTASVDAETGANRFVEAADGLHRYVVKARPDEAYRDEINRLIATE